MNRKALEQNVLVAAILIIIFIIVMAVIIPKIVGVANEANQKEKCKESVLIYSRAATWGLPLSDSIKCPTKYIKISTNNDYEAERTIANEMYDCWDNFGQGKQELFGTQNEDFCVVCSVISFSGKEREISGFDEFLANEKIPTREETYLEFLTGETLENQGQQSPNADGGFSINTGKEYAVMFTYAKKSRMSIIAKTTIGAVSGAVLAVGGVILIATGIGAPVGLASLSAAAAVGMSSGFLIGSQSGSKTSEWQAAVMLVNSSDVGNIGCTYLQKTK
ncbi:hypothetical protein COT07_01055 [Candidatus Woesearchaeota archaeon CG07_land_8_20_14_0_80_44_23]|nr:MAG: hypothetical protein COT07_01055 [Candidatus Woesearchaeota archaeon CG07_land_8_20_14_0_80_44_23]